MTLLINGNGNEVCIHLCGAEFQRLTAILVKGEEAASK